MVNFLKMGEVEKIRFLADNIPENVETSSFKKIDGKWTDVLKKYTKNMGLPQSVLTSIFTGAAIGAVTLIAAAFNVSKLMEDDE
jgi:flagellar basal body rod protein FlgG